MRWFVLLLVLAGCPPKSEPQEPTTPKTPDAAVIDAAPTPMQTPQASTSIRASSYAQNCTRDDDCVAVFEGDACQPCRCAFNAIRVDAFPKYKADLGAFWACHKPDDCPKTCEQITGGAAKCQESACVLPPP